jgi:hypothetical protein
MAVPCKISVFLINFNVTRNNELPMSSYPALVFLIFKIFLMVLGVELRASCLLGSYSTIPFRTGEF